MTNQPTSDATAHHPLPAIAAAASPHHLPPVNMRVRSYDIEYVFGHFGSPVLPHLQAFCAPSRAWEAGKVLD